MAEIEERRKLDLVLPVMLEAAEAYTRVTTLRRLLDFCGLRPTVTYLTEALARLGTYVETVKINDSRRLVLPGVRVTELCVPRARERLAKDWNDRLHREGLPLELPQLPMWLVSSGGFSVRGENNEGADWAAGDPGQPDRFSPVVLPGDWENESKDTMAARIHAATIAREAAGVYHATMSDYMWRVCDWRNYSALDHLVLEMHVVDGLDAKEIGRKIGKTRACCKAILQRHRALAGIVPRGRQVKK